MPLYGGREKERRDCGRENVRKNEGEEVGEKWGRRCESDNEE